MQMNLAILSMLWPFFLSMHVLVLLRMDLGFGHVGVGIASSVLGGNETDRLALLAFKAEITGDPSGALSSWNGSIHFCQWVGVTCGHRHHQRVIMLDLGGQELTGSISAHIGNLSFLRKLWLINNSLSHKIPPELGRLKRLQVMSLRNNSITGEIPANISGCSSLISLEFSMNPLMGKIPMELGFLSKLKKLFLWKNNLTGVIPSTFGNLSSLQTIYAAENSITGNIPDILGRLTNLQVLELGSNRLVGTIPSTIFNISSIQVINVVNNQIRGKLPSYLGITLPNLQFLGVGQNLFTGSIPFSISNASKLQRFAIEANQFTGKVPSLEKLHYLLWLSFSSNYLGTGEASDLSFLSSLTNATNLYILALNDNNFGGTLPESVSNFSANLYLLLVNINKISGSIPTGIGNLVKLERIDLWINEFTGEIPASIGQLQQLKQLSLSDNKFSKNIPSSLGNLTLLIKLHLARNNFSGNIPSSLGKCQFLTILNLGGNNLNGTIPIEVMSLSSLLYLSVSQNHLTGSLPVEVGNLINLEELIVSENMLSGQIPETIGSCVELRLLYMQKNSFQGILPPSLSNLRGIEELDLSHNNFSGKIPAFFGDFVFLQKLNLSLNDFEGAIPEGGIFKNTTAIFVKGNNKLCGGIPELHLPSCNSKRSGRKRSTLTLKLIIPIALGLVGLVLMVCFLYLSWYKKSTEVVPSLRVLGNTFQKVSYQSLFKATGGFTPANLIGLGSFGSVYKGILDQGGKVVAVKVLNLDFHGTSKSFIAECKALKSIKHRNLVKLLTVCSSIDYLGNDFKALVYDYMVNGSLEDWLHPNENEDEVNEDSKNLNLLQRLNIAIDAAYALDYLHNHCPEPIVHCDLKPSNILLDSDMTGHIGDFGLARFLPKATCESSANQSSSMGMRGSVGYAAPEYGMGNEVSTSGDVYSYGILLLELFTKKRPTDNMFCDSLSLHNFVKMTLPKQVANIVDRTLFEQRGKGEASSSISNAWNQSSIDSHKKQECLISILKVGITCSEELPTDRMAINDVVTQLHMIKNTHFGASGVHGGRRATTGM